MMGDHADAGNAAMEVLAARLHRLNQGIKELQGLNINTALSSLPKYAVVGDQSAGKSSIVEALCGTSLPRSSGTTTRCPFLITTHKTSSSTEAWKCEVSIKKQDYGDNDQGQVSNQAESSIKHFATITREKELGDTLRRAQLAILNPQDDPKDYVNIDLSDENPTTKLFSRNIICLDIQAPDLPELMFYDLPGCINVYDMSKTAGINADESQEQERQLIEMIKSTVTSYIQDEKCLLLLACSADQDVEMSLTMKHIRDNKSESRCIGVFTKADLVIPSKLQSVQDILKGHKYQLGRGWYMTKQLSQQELDAGVEYADARELERELFDSPPWVDDFSLKDRYGLPNLQDQIGRSLASHIVTELPKVAQRIEIRLSIVKAELDQFPTPSKEPNYEVMTSIEQFVRCLASHINADSDDNPFRMQFDKLLAVFGEQLLASKLEVSVERADERPNGENAGAAQAQNESTKLSHKKRSKEPASCKRLTSSTFGSAVDTVVHQLADLQLRYDRGATNSIPGSINDKVTEQLIRDSCAKWRDIVAELLKDVGSLVRRMIKDSMEEAIVGRKHTKLYEAMQHATLEYFNKTITLHGEGKIFEHLARMHACPTTFSKTSEGPGLRRLVSERYPEEWDRHCEAPSSTPDAAKVPLKQLCKESASADSQWVNDRLVDDKYAQMLRCVAKIHAFHEVLGSNLTDTASMQLKFDVLTKFRDEAAGMLRTELKVLDTAHCAALLAEDAGREKRRKQLLAEEAKLEKALAVIENLDDEE